MKPYSKQVLSISIVLLAFILGGFIHYKISLPTWEDQQVKIYNFLSPVPVDALGNFDQDVLQSEGKQEKEQEEVQAEGKSIEELIREVFGDNADRAIEIARCESGLRSVCNDGVNSNGSVDCGIFQINSIHGVRSKWLLNPDINIRVAYQIFTEQGNFSAWVCDRKV